MCGGGFYLKDEEFEEEESTAYIFIYGFTVHHVDDVATCRASACPCPRGAGEARGDYGELMVMGRFAEVLGLFSIQDVGGTRGHKE